MCGAQLEIERTLSVKSAIVTDKCTLMHHRVVWMCALWCQTGIHNDTVHA